MTTGDVLTHCYRCGADYNKHTQFITIRRDKDAGTSFRVLSQILRTDCPICYLPPQLAPTPCER
jgi:hypothetical protein